MTKYSSVETFTYVSETGGVKGVILFQRTILVNILGLGRSPEKAVCAIFCMMNLFVFGFYMGPPGHFNLTTVQ